MQTHVHNSVTGNIQETILGEAIMHLPLLMCLLILNMWDLLYVRDL